MAPNTLNQPVTPSQKNTNVHMQQTSLIPAKKGLFINNEFVPATSGEKIETINPYDESLIATVQAAGEKDIDAAVAAARAAFKTGSEWRNLTPQERGVLLWKLGDLCKRDEAILATIDAWDNGKFFFGGDWLLFVKGLLI
jgi:acyl-CoA reductase-like NAD-dependent aldehyde dehydrogenase